MAELEASDDMAYEILSRVDGLTLAVASCLNSHLHSISRDERLWEKACSNRWPSTNDPPLKSLITSSLGGFRAFYAHCYPRICSMPQGNGDGRAQNELGINGQPSIPSPDDFISIVDVVFGGAPLYSTAIHGMPPTHDSYGWFSNLPFRIDALGGVVDAGFPSLEAMAKEGRNARVWNALWENIRLSWIIVSKETHQMVNVSSWRPTSGRRNWPTDEEYELRFGSLLPAHTITSCNRVRCDITMRCKLQAAKLAITELSLQLQGMAAAHLDGEQSLVVLRQALGGCRSQHGVGGADPCVLYRQMKDERLRLEGRLDMAGIALGVAAFIFLCCKLLMR